ncbi:MAG TPA: FmdB family zinc ribbon protein [Gemmatimonadales bacterium]|nr:FmdB family zinc ribbon protein [Gemmatimonadales bacterium]
MPTYEYVCLSGHTFERFEKMSDAPRTKCPVCGKRAVRQISGGAGLVFKGSGFYITDYGKDGKGPRKADKGGGKQEKGAEKPAAAEKSEPTGPDKGGGGGGDSSGSAPKAPA